MTVAGCLIVILVNFFLFINIEAFAADHKDGPMVGEKDYLPADILDFFAFPTADGARLVLAMTLKFDAKDNPNFGANISYRFRLRKGTVDAKGRGPTRRVELSTGHEEDVIECKTLVPDRGKNKMKCTLNAGSCPSKCLTSEETVDDIANEIKPKELRVFAGLVRDPFFSDVFRVRKKRPRNSNPMFILPDFNPFKNYNALAIVVEVPIDALESGSRILAAVAETTISDVKGETKSRRIDRMGNVEITNFVLCFRPIDIEKSQFLTNLVQYLTNQIEFPCPSERAFIKNDYNRVDAFDKSNDRKARDKKYETWISIGLKALDRIDSDTDGRKKEILDWPHADPTSSSKIKHPFVDLFVKSDWLIVDTQKKCNTEKGTSTYFDIQMSAYFLGDNSHLTCGGRTPNEDVIDKTLTLFVNGPERLPTGWWGRQSGGPVRTDGVDQAHTVAISKFPWLVANPP